MTNKGWAFSRRVDILLLALLILASGLLRFHDLEGKSLWRDEIETHVFTQEEYSRMTRLALEIPYIPVPPLYFYVTRLVGVNLFEGLSLRWPAALFGLLLIPVVWFTAREIARPEVGLATAAFTAFSPFMVRYSQEARSYSLLVLLVLTAIFFLIRAAGEGRKAHWAGFAASTILAMYTHFFALLILPPAFLYTAVIRLKGVGISSEGLKRVLRTLPVWMAVILAYWPMAEPLLRGLSGERGLRLQMIEPNFHLGQVPSLLAVVGPAGSPWMWLVFILAVIGALARRPWRPGGRLLVLLMVGIPFGLAALIPFHHALRLRYLIFVIPLYYLLASAGVCWLVQGRKRRHGLWMASAGLTVSAAVLISSLSGLSGYYGEGKQDWRSAALFLEDTAEASDLILVDGRGYRNLNLRYRVLDHYAGLGDRISIVKVGEGPGDLAESLDQREGRLWYVNTLTPKNRGEELFWGASRHLEKRGWKIGAPLKFDAPEPGPAGEVWWIGPTRYRSVLVVPAYREPHPDRESLTSGAFLDRARRIKGADMDDEFTFRYLEASPSP
jgi:hypothetical protein